MPLTGEAKRRRFGIPCDNLDTVSEPYAGGAFQERAHQRGGAAAFLRTAPKNRSILQIKRGAAVFGSPRNAPRIVGSRG
jgi:hypothetical protein